LLAVVTGGGTGGHVIPAMAIMEAFLKKGVDVLYIGSKNGIESKIVGSDVKSLFLNLKGIKGKGFLEAIKGLYLTFVAFFRLLFCFISIKPTVVVGTGGFVCFPAAFAGFVCGCRVYLQEQNAVPGASIKLLSLVARRVFLGFEDAKEFLPKTKTEFSGNPLREEFLTQNRGYQPHKKGERLKVLVLGGSQGANFINKLILETISLLPKEDYYFYHQAGEKNREGIEQIYKEKGIEAKVIGFAKDIHKYYFEAHLIVARAGAMTVSEIIASLRPSILIPFPYAIYDHQRKNAETLQKIGATYLFLEKDITAEILAKTLKELYENPDKLSDMSKSLSMIKFNNAADFITKRILEDVNCTKTI